MNLKHEKIIEEALRRHERGDGFETFLKSHPEVQSEVREMVEIGKRISALAEHIPVPRQGFEKALRGIHISDAALSVEAPVVSPYLALFSSTYIRFAVPALMVLLIVVGVGVYPGEQQQVQDVAGTAQTEMMSMKAMSAPSDGAVETASFAAPQGEAADAPMMSMMASDEVSLRSQSVASVDDLVRELQQEATIEIASATQADADFALATESGAAVLHDFKNIYDESTL